MPSPIRLKKIADRIRDDLSELLIYEVEDPRLQGVMVTDVNVDRELYYANIYVSAIEGRERSKEVLAGLESASAVSFPRGSNCAHFRNCASTGILHRKTRTALNT